ncbi:MAG: DMT family transporter [Gaiellaceae bacterium]
MRGTPRLGGGSFGGVALLLFAMGLWSGSFRVTAEAAGHTSAIMISALRTAPAALLLLVALPLLRGRLPQSRRMWFWAFVTGMLMVVLFLEGLSEGTARAGAANASVLANTTPFFVLILAWFFLKAKTNWLGIVGLLMGFGGVVLMVSTQLGSTSDTGDFVLGMVLALLGAAGWGIGTLIVKWLIDQEPEIDLVGFTAAQHLIGAVVLLALAFGIEGTGGTEWGSGELWASLAYLGAIASAIATIAFYGALRRVDATIASAFLFLVPAGAVLIEIGFGNAPGATVLAGMCVAIAGVALVNFAPALVERRVPA